jgi:hypothetical protein
MIIRLTLMARCWMFQQYETYLMKLPEDGPENGPKHVAIIK